MTRKTYDVLYSVTEYLKGDDFGICSNINVRNLFPDVSCDFVLEGVWLFYRSTINEIYYYTGVPCDKVYLVDSDLNINLYLYKLE